MKERCIVWVIDQTSKKIIPHVSLRTHYSRTPVLQKHKIREARGSKVVVVFLEININIIKAIQLYLCCLNLNLIIV